MPGRGLEGDRYFWGLGTFSDGTDTELTLVEAEAVEALAREHGLDLEPGEARRKEFRIGEVRLRGVRLAEPCAHLARLVGREALQGLAHRGGLRAEILAGGVLRAGDAVEEEPRCP